MTESLITEETIAYAKKLLSQNDGRLKLLFNAIGEFSPPNKSLEYKSVCRIIINQQLSGKAADTIFCRIEKSIPNINPQSILGVKSEVLRSCGVSRAKIEYLKRLAQRLEEDPGYFENLAQMESIDAKQVIWSNKGFGEWSSEIFLLFHLRRANVFPKGDVTLNKVVAEIYGIDPRDENKIYQLSESWSPYKSVVSLALWRYFDLGLIR